MTHMTGRRQQQGRHLLSSSVKSPHNSWLLSTTSRLPLDYLSTTSRLLTTTHDNSRQLTTTHDNSRQLTTTFGHNRSFSSGLKYWNGPGPSDGISLNGITKLIWKIFLSHVKMSKPDILRSVPESQVSLRAEIIAEDPNRDAPTLEGGFNALVHWFRESVTTTN
jgi:hypothetical protein